MGKKILILIVVLIIVGLGFYFYNKNEAKAPTIENNTVSQATSTPSSAPSAAVTTTLPTVPLPAATAGGGENTGSNVQVWEVDYNGTSFSPQTVTINQNDWVFFKNKSTINFWPKASTAGGFDAGSAIAPGKEFKFQFTKTGSFSYSDHLNQAAQGTVVVQ